MGLMDMMVRAIKKEKREDMMIDMMPRMMAGIDMTQLMPKMMVAMCQNVTSDDVAEAIRNTVQSKETLKEMGNRLLEINPMIKMMMKRYRSVLSFDDTVDILMARIPMFNWSIPDTRDIQKLWTAHGVKDAPQITVIYLCNAMGGFELTKSDDMKALSVMMPMGLSIYKLSTGEVEIAHMDLGMMASMFTGSAREILSQSAQNLNDALVEVIE